MILHGDELGRTQSGNNNTYAQDSELSWIDWARVDEPLVEFVASRRAYDATIRRSVAPVSSTATRSYAPRASPCPTSPRSHLDGRVMTPDDWDAASAARLRCSSTAMGSLVALAGTADRRRPRDGLDERARRAGHLRRAERRALDQVVGRRRHRGATRRSRHRRRREGRGRRPQRRRTTGARAVARGPRFVGRRVDRLGVAPGSIDES